MGEKGLSSPPDEVGHLMLCLSTWGEEKFRIMAVWPGAGRFLGREVSFEGGWDGKCSPERGHRCGGHIFSRQRTVPASLRRLVKSVPRGVSDTHETL